MSSMDEAGFSWESAPVWLGIKTRDRRVIPRQPGAASGQKKRVSIQVDRMASESFLVGRENSLSKATIAIYLSARSLDNLFYMLRQISSCRKKTYAII